MKKHVGTEQTCPVIVLKTLAHSSNKIDLFKQIVLDICNKEFHARVDSAVTIALKFSRN
jgi:hypothetical protein